MLQQPPMPSVWTSLEITKLIVSALTPLAVAIVGLWLSRRLKRFEFLQWANQKAIEKRLSVYSDLAPVLNDIYCYFDYIGNSVALTPVEAIELKRKADRLFFVNAPLFSDSYRREYQTFINQCFEPGPETDLDKSARLKTDIELRKKYLTKGVQKWDSDWDILFVPKQGVNERKAIRESYWQMMGVFAKELGVGLDDRG